MAALLRCAARRLGGSLLQRTHAAERPQLLSPSRLMHTRGEHARADLTRDIQQRKKEMHDVISKWEKESMTIGAAQHLSMQVTPRPHDSHLNAQLSYQPNNTHVRNLTSKLGQMKQEMYDAIFKSYYKVTLGGRTYNIRESNDRRLERLATAVKDAVVLAFCILFGSLELCAILFELTFCLFLFGSPIVFIIMHLMGKIPTTTGEDKIEN